MDFCAYLLKEINLVATDEEEIRSFLRNATGL